MCLDGPEEDASSCPRPGAEVSIHIVSTGMHSPPSCDILVTALTVKCGNQLETEFSHSLAQLHSSFKDKKIASAFTGLPWQLVKLGRDVGADNMA